MCVLRCVLLLQCVLMICRALGAFQRRFDRYLNRPRWKVIAVFVIVRNCFGVVDEKRVKTDQEEPKEPKVST